MAAKTAMIRARVEPEVKAEAEKVLGRLGITPSAAIAIFYKQVALRQGLPFPVEVPNALTRKTLRDADAGKGLKRYESAEAMYEKLGM